MKTASLRAIPAVEKILQALGETGLPRPVVTALVRRELAALRNGKTIPAFAEITARLRGQLDLLRLARIQPVINGTGVLLHTNLGRAPLAAAAVRRLASIAANYANLEIDLATGERGARGGYLEHNLALLCGAPAATVVNNCAAALVLILRHFTAGERKEIVISRGELVQIGGGFRIPEILEASGAQLKEVGSTNRTSPGDYARAIGPRTAMILKVHRSNFFMEGFVDSPATAEIAALARRKRLPFIEDLGSGAMTATDAIAGIGHEPTPAESLRQGASLVCFSGDKLFGGPQAGVIAGRAALVRALKREPFFRALRCDKLILAALEATTDLHLGGVSQVSDESESVPVLAMLRLSESELRPRAEAISTALSGLPVTVKVERTVARIGGGTLPKSAIPSVTVDLCPSSMPVADFAARLRLGTPPLIGKIANGRFKIDLRTVFPRQDAGVIGAIRHALNVSDG